MSDARGVMTEVMYRFGKRRNARRRLAEACSALGKLGMVDIANPLAVDVYKEIGRRLSVHGPVERDDREADRGRVRRARRDGAEA